MDAARKLKKIFRNNRGMAIVYIAILLFVLLAFVGLAVDIGYMYVVKGQLQNAADSSALAGSARLHGANNVGAFVNHSGARREAWRFACKNRAAGSNVFVVDSGATDCGSPPSDLNNSNDPTGDIVVGNWDGTTFQEATTGTSFLINAIKVNAQRVGGLESTGRGAVDVFIGQIFRMIGADWSKMSATAIATAARPPRANINVAICFQACSSVSNSPPAPTVLNPPRIFQTGPNLDPTTQFAWTTLLDNPTAPGFNLNALICGNNESQDVCNQSIWSSMGASTSALKMLESVFYDPTTPKDSDGGWWVLVPVTASCPPGQQGNAWDPKPVTRYAKVRIIQVCAAGGGTSCPGRSPAPPGACPGGANYIKVDRIACVNCPASDLVGFSPVLVK